MHAGGHLVQQPASKWLEIHPLWGLYAFASRQSRLGSARSRFLPAAHFLRHKASKSNATTTSSAAKLSIALAQNNMVDKGAIRVFANAYTETVQTAMQVYIDGQLKLSDSESSFVDQTYSASPGQHQVVVKAWDADGHNVSKSAVVTVQ